MKESRLWEILREAYSSRLWLVDVTKDEISYCMGNELVATIQGHYQPHVYNTGQNHEINPHEIPWHPAIDGLTDKGRRELQRLTRLLGLEGTY